MILPKNILPIFAAMHRTSGNTIALTLKQMVFCEIYAAQAPFFNGREAARQAGYIPNGTDQSLGTQSNRLLNNPLVQEYICQLRDEAAQRSRVTLDEIIDRLVKIAWFDIRTLYNEDGDLKEPHELDDIAAAAIAGVEIDELTVGSGALKMAIGTRTKYKLKDGMLALQMLITSLGYAPKEKKVKRDAMGNIIETETTEADIPQHRVIFEDYAEPVKQIANGD